ncbi:hypothetical protein [Reyranella sp. CPCC 100927]|uniref:hypothetical protein n=1 Tax=Reyranella sp. CPCC 100927 TaxID=2599616 RepID=UPI0011B3F9A9|nr:hypothetical protein [Reyranella sp. CPCC 100927]TWS97884.1 hypothetical protein FQU96_36890 [Reyranella sp. CPCC 100927]
MIERRQAALFALAFCANAFSLGSSSAQITDAMRRPDNLMIVLRESGGSNKPDESLKPVGKGKVIFDGQEREVQFAWFFYLGDMHVRFVYDSTNVMANLTIEDFEKLRLSPDEALRLAVANIKRVYGKPGIVPWTGGLMQVKGKSPDVDSSYFLDREFWRGLLKQNPAGVVAAVPKRGGLLFAPLSDAKAVDGLRKGIAYLHSSSERMRVSSALYLFKDDHWTVFQAPQAQ